MKLEKIVSLGDLRRRKETEPAYEQLAILAANNLGRLTNDFEESMRWLIDNAAETCEEGVVDEVNFCIDLL